MSKKSMIVIGSSIVGVLVLLILIIWLLTLFKGSYTTYEKVEQLMANAADKYYKTYPEMLPVNEGKYSLQYSALVDGEFIKPLNKLLKDGDSCNAEVYVYKTEVSYDYVPMLNCGDNYKTVELFQKIMDDNPVVSTNSGLYKATDGSYYFRGKIDNNYVSLGTIGSGKRQRAILWRIMGIDSNGNIKIKSIESFTDKTVYDNRYNAKQGKNVGYNNYEESILKDYLANNSGDESFLTNNQKEVLVQMPLCYGKRKMNEQKVDGSVECSLKSDPVYFGTITPYEYMRVSLDKNCKKLTDKSCGNFNYLYNDLESEWSITASTESDFEVYTLNGAAFELSRASYSKKVYPTAYISARVLFKGGDGSEKNPYIIKTKEEKKN